MQNLGKYALIADLMYSIIQITHEGHAGKKHVL